MLGISFDSVQENAAFAQKQNFPFRLLCDTERQVGLAYSACDNAQAGYAKRISYLMDEEGRVSKAYDKVNSGSHPAEVLADLTDAKGA